MTLPAPIFKKILNKDDALNGDIIKQLHTNFNEAVGQTKDFSKQFEAGDKKATAKNVWQYFKKYITYKKDGSAEQLIRLPSRFIAGEAEGDCKSYSLAVASILYNLGFKNVRFRYANYHWKSGETPTHVYVVAQDDNNDDVIVDAVWNKFDSEKPAHFKFDRPIMRVYTLAGIGKAKKSKGSFFSKIGKGLKKINVGKGLKKLGLALPRKMFQSLVFLNVHGLATKLKAGYVKNPAKTLKFWEDLGGNRKNLLNSINSGARKKSILGIDGIESLPPYQQHIYKLMIAARDAKKRGDKARYIRIMMELRKRRMQMGKRTKRRRRIKGINGAQDMEGIGFAIPAALATAAPILIQAAKLLRELGVGGKKTDKDGNVVESSADKIIETAEKAYEQVRPGGGGGSGGGGGGEVPDLSDPEVAKTVDTETGKDDSPTGGGNNKILLIAGGAALLLLFLGKKKA